MHEDLNLEISDEDIKKRVKLAINLLIIRDSYLLEKNASERSISHKLAEYLQTLFPCWNVDCEYNLNVDEGKVLHRISECDERKTTDRVFPDIIIHKRGSTKNLLVVEMKKNKLDPKCDNKKLELFTSPQEDYKYSLGLFLDFEGTKIDDRWYKAGRLQKDS